MDEMISIIKSFGLTDYESKAYITILRLGICTAEQLSEYANIPLPRVYDTVGELQKKGFVLVTKTRPKKFKAVTPEKALNRLIEDRKKEMSREIEKLKHEAQISIKKLSSIENLSNNEEKLDMWTTRKRKNVMAILEEQKATAKKEVLIFSGDLSWINENADILKDLNKKKITIKILAKPLTNKQIKSNVSLAKKLGAKVKTGYTGKLRGHIVDGKVAAIAIKVSNEKIIETHPYSKYELVVFNNQSIVSAFKENFEFWWKNLK